MDIVCSLLVTIAFSWLFLLIAILIKISSKGPVFFLQERLGLNGSVYKIVKFRTMVVNAENLGDGLKVKSESDPRITKTGRLLRKTSLDELPNLFNVLAGSMSLVGPRPPAVYHPYNGYENYPDWAKKRFEMRPGITGLAQATVRNSVAWDDRIVVDNQYIDKFNVILDIKIMFMTVVRLLSKEDIYAPEKGFKTLNQSEKEMVKKCGESRMRISIRPFKREDIPYKVAWVNDRENNMYLHYNLPLEIEKTEKWYEGVLERTDRFDATILSDGIPVGIIGLLNIDRVNQKAEYYILVGDCRHKKNGVATKASELILEYGFSTLGLNRIYLFTEAGNIPAQKLFEKIGFIKEGTLHSDIKSHGQFADRIVYGLLNKEWNK